MPCQWHRDSTTESRVLVQAVEHLLHDWDLGSWPVAPGQAGHLNVTEKRNGRPSDRHVRITPEVTRLSANPARSQRESPASDTWSGVRVRHVCPLGCLREHNSRDVLALWAQFDDVWGPPGRSRKLASQGSVVPPDAPGRRSRKLASQRPVLPLEVPA